MIKFLKRESNLVEVRGTIKSIRIEKDAFLLKIVSDDLLGLANYNDIDFNELHQKYSRGEFFTTNINPVFLQTIYKLYKKGKSCFFTFKGLNITAVELEEYTSKDSIMVKKEENTEKIEEIKNFVKEVEHETENIPEISQTTLITESIDEISVEKYQEQIDLNEIQAISEEFKEEITPVAMARPSKELLVSEFQDTEKDELESELSKLAEVNLTIEDESLEAVQETVIDEEITEETEVETLESVQEEVIAEEITEETEVETLEAVQEAVIDEEITEETEVETLETVQETVIDEEITEEETEVETLEAVQEAVINEEITEEETEVESLEAVQETVIDEEITEEETEVEQFEIVQELIEEKKEEKVWPKVEYLIQNEEVVTDELETTTLPENIDEGSEVNEEIVEELILSESDSEIKEEIKEESIINNLDISEDDLPQELNKTDLIQEKLDELTELNEYEALKEEIMKKDSEAEISYNQNNIDIEEEQTARVLDTLSSFSSIMESLDNLNELSKEIDEMENELKEYDLQKEQENNDGEEFDVDLDEKSDDFNTEEIPEEILNELEKASSPIVEEFYTIEEENLSEIDKLSIEIEDVETLEEIELQKLETPEETKEIHAEKEDKKSIDDEISDFEDELPTKIH